MRRLIQRIRPRRAERAPEPAEAPPGTPAGVEPADATAPHAPSFRDRGRLRRRLRYLRRVRELAFRDLGGLVYDQHRFEKPNEQLVQGKVEALAAIDRELRALEIALDDRRPLHELREPGISSCPRCGALHGSEANWCPQCGFSLRERHAAEEPSAPAPPAVAPQPDAREQPTVVAPAAGGEKDA
jgi:ribosomal protein L40E